MPSVDQEADQMMPLTVIKVDHAITQEEAQIIHDQFRDAVRDERPMIVVGPGTDMILVEPYAPASRRAWLALLAAVLALIIATIALILLLT